MPVDSTHLDYDANVTPWLRAREVFAGEDAVKAAGVRYLPKLDAQTEDEFAAYKARASFFNATARTEDKEPLSGAVFTFRSSDDRVATVDQAGVVTGRREGSVILVATTGPVRAETRVNVVRGTSLP